MQALKLLGVFGEDANMVDGMEAFISSGILRHEAGYLTENSSLREFCLKCAISHTLGYMPVYATADSWDPLVFGGSEEALIEYLNFYGKHSVLRSLPRKSAFNT